MVVPPLPASLGQWGGPPSGIAVFADNHLASPYLKPNLVKMR